MSVHTVNQKEKNEQRLKEYNEKLKKHLEKPYQDAKKKIEKVKK